MGKKKINTRLSPRLILTHHQFTPDTTFDNQYGHKKTSTKYQNTNPPFLSALTPASSPQIQPPPHSWHTPSFSPFLGPLAASMELGSSTPNAPNFFFSGVLTKFISRSPCERVDTCRDRALNASGWGYYSQAKTGRAAKATHGTQVPL